MFENGHITLCYVMLNKYAGENIVRLHADKKRWIIGIEPTTFALRKQANSKMSTIMSIIKINF